MGRPMLPGSMTAGGTWLDPPSAGVVLMDGSVSNSSPGFSELPSSTWVLLQKSPDSGGLSSSTEVMRDQTPYTASPPASQVASSEAPSPHSAYIISLGDSSTMTGAHEEGTMNDATSTIRPTTFVIVPTSLTISSFNILNALSRNERPKSALASSNADAVALKLSSISDSSPFADDDADPSNSNSTTGVTLSEKDLSNNQTDPSSVDAQIDSSASLNQTLVATNAANGNDGTQGNDNDSSATKNVQFMISYPYVIALLLIMNWVTPIP